MHYRNRKLLLIVLIILLGFTSVFYANIKYSMATVEDKFKFGNDKAKIIILIDPGHGGVDGGASGKNGTMEKDINLKISLKLKDGLVKEGYEVVMIREEDKGLYIDEGRIRKKKLEDLNNRVKMKKDSNCDMFISIHLNAFPESKYYGAQVWYSKNKDSQRFARIVQQNLKVDLDSTNNRHEKSALDSYKVLRVNDDMPSVLIECGFLSNQMEEQKLVTNEYQNKIAESIVKSVQMYYSE